MRELSITDYKGVKRTFTGDVTYSFRGYGHYNIKFKLNYKNNVKTFTEVTSDMPFIDEISDIEDREIVDDLLFGRFFDKDMEDKVLEWLCDIDEEIY